MLLKLNPQGYSQLDI